MSRLSSSEVVLKIFKNISYSYFIEARIDLFLSYLAKDIIWIGAGKNMSRSGYDNVAQFFIDNQKQLLPCIMSSEEYVVKKISTNTYLCQLCSDLKTTPSSNIYLHEYQRVTMIFTRNKNATNKEGWEISYLHHSIPYKNLKEGELFAISHGLETKETIYATKTVTAPSKDRKTMYMLAKKSYQSMAREMKTIFLLMSLFNNFTHNMARYMCRYINAKELLEEEITRNAFLYFNDYNGEYSFHPVLMEYLQNIFRQEDVEWQNNQYSRAAKLFLSLGQYKEAINYAFIGNDYSVLMKAIELNGIESLLEPCNDISNAMLQKCPENDKKRFIKACFIILFNAFINGDKEFILEELPKLDTVIREKSTDDKLKIEYKLWIVIFKSMLSYKDLVEVNNYFENILLLIEKNRGKTNLFISVTFGSPSILSIYHNKIGELENSIDCIQELLRSFSKTVKVKYDLCWDNVVRAEWEYLTGNPHQAILTLENSNLYSSTVHGYDIERCICLCFLNVRLASFYGDNELLSDFIKNFKIEDSEYFSNFYLNMLFLSKAFLLPYMDASEKQIKEALSIIKRSKFLAYCRSFVALVEERLLLEQKEYAKIAQSALKNYQLALDEKDIIVAIYEAIILSVAYIKLNASNKAQQSLVLAIELAEIDHLVMPFVEYHKDISNELQTMLEKDKYVSFIKDIQKVAAEEAAGIQKNGLKMFLVN